jgi:predicted nucleotidyltransferase
MAQQIDAEAFRQTLAKLLQLFGESGIRGAVIGGLAAAAWGRERYTRDIDAVSTAGNDDLDRLFAVAQALGLEPRRADYAQFAKHNRMILLQDVATGLGVDISMAGFPFEFEVVDRAATIEVAGIRVPVGQADDILIMKALAGRDIDLADIAEILSSNPEMDLSRVREYLPQFAEATDDPEMLERFERIVRQVWGQRP